jgi:hypothetical protein
MNLQTAAQTSSTAYRAYRSTAIREATLPDRALPVLNKKLMAGFDSLRGNKSFTLDGALQALLTRPR